MDASAKAKRNHTAPGATFQPEWARERAPAVASDALLGKLGQMLESAGSQAKARLADGFIKEGFTDADLLLSQLYNDTTSSVDWMRHALQFEQHTPTTLRAHEPLVTDRLMSALHVLGQSPHQADLAFGADAHKHAQRVLNEVLLAHPVLMHPRVRVTITCGVPEGSCSVVHAISVLPFAHFPCPSDWPEGEAPMERLTDFARHDLVRRVMRSAVRSIRHEGELEGVEARSWFSSAMKLRKRHPALLASLHQLGKLMNDGNAEKAVLGDILHDWKALHRPEDSVHENGILADALYDSSGFAYGEMVPSAHTRYYRDPHFWAYVSALPEDRRESLRFTLRSKLVNAVFGWSALRPNPEDVTHNLGALTEALTQASIFESTQKAAMWIRSQLRESDFSTIDTHLAVAFARAMRQLDAPLLSVDLPRTQQADQSLEVTWPSWAEALRIESAEHTMNSVIESAGVEKQPSAPGPRRSRKGV